jgi:hypothetical protein
VAAVDGVKFIILREDDVFAAAAPYGVLAWVLTCFYCINVVGLASALEHVRAPQASQGVWAVVAKELIVSVGGGILHGRVVAEQYVEATAASEQVVVLPGEHIVFLVGAIEPVWVVCAHAGFSHLAVDSCRPCHSAATTSRAAISPIATMMRFFMRTPPFKKGGVIRPAVLRNVA